VPVDDCHANAAPAKLVGEHQARRAGSNHKNISHHLNSFDPPRHKGKARATLTPIVVLEKTGRIHAV
jgi:hypothetical protein